MLIKILSLSFVLVLFFTGCSEEMALSFEEAVDSQKVEITAIDGYIRDASMTDSAGQSATYKANGVYVFNRAVTYPIELSGGFLDETDSPFDIVMQAGDGSLISPITTVLHKYPELESYLVSNIGTIDSLDELESDYIESNNTDIAKLSQLMYVMLKDSNLTESFSQSLQNSSSTSIDDIFVIASSEISDSNLSGKNEMVALLDVVKVFTGDVVNLEKNIQEVKDILIDIVVSDSNGTDIIDNNTTDNNVTDTNTTIVIDAVAPIFTSSATANVNENQTSAITLVATDADSDTLTYSISGTDAGSFSVASITGVVTFLVAPDYETKSSYSFTATVNDGTTDVNQSIIVSINNLNDNAPIFTSSATANVNENQTSAITLVATDADSDTLTYSISGTDAGSFSVASITGVVTFLVAPDYETKSSYSFTATVNDGTNSVDQSVTINILDIDEIAPTIIGYTPTPAATGVDINTTIVLEYSEEMNASSIAVLLTDSNGAEVNIDITYSTGSYIATITPSSNLEYSESYTVHIPISAMDLAGNIISESDLLEFTTKNAPDITAPTIISSSPSIDATNISVGSSITVEFSEAIDETTLTISVSSTTSSVPGHSTYDSGNNSATFYPDSGVFDFIDLHTVAVSVEDLAGNLLSTSFTFTTSKELLFSYKTANWFSARANHQMINFENSLYVIGGYDGTYENDVWINNDSNWSQVTIAPFSPRSDHQAVVYNDRVYVIGGNDGTYKGDVWSTSDLNTWTNETNSTLFSARIGHQVVVYNGKMYLIGGNDGQPMNDIYSSSNGSTWSEIRAYEYNSTECFKGRSGHQVVVYNGKMYLIGGYDGSVFKNDVWSSSDGLNWTEETASAGFTARDGHRVVVYNDKMYLIGGVSNGSMQKDVWSSSDGKTWHQETDAGFTARAGHQLALFDDRIYMSGGIDGTDTYQADVYYSDDISAPSLVSTYPDANETGINPDSNITFILNEGFTTPSGYSLSLVYSSDEQPVSGNSYTSTTSFIIDPTSILVDDTNYTARLTASIVMDASGNTRDIDYSFNFTTGTAPIVHNGTTYGTVTSPQTGKVWLDRNLGASQVCIASNDTACYGDYYQWGRNYDGHQESNSTLLYQQASDVNNAGSSFRIDDNSSYNDWAYWVDSSGTTRSSNWSSIDGSSICPAGFRVPTSAELDSERTFSTIAGAFSNFLKLPTAGYRGSSTGTLMYSGTHGFVWSTSSTNSPNSDYLTFSDYSAIEYSSRSYGWSVRCIKD